MSDITALFASDLLFEVEYPNPVCMLVHGHYPARKVAPPSSNQAVVAVNLSSFVVGQDKWAIVTKGRVAKYFIRAVLIWRHDYYYFDFKYKVF